MQYLLAAVLYVACFLTQCVTANSQVSHNPVTKVVELLTDLKAKIERDGKSEELVYNKYACWCEETTARKAKDIERAEFATRRLSLLMLKSKGKIETLLSEIEELAQAMNDNEQAQADATDLLAKENAAHQEESEETKKVLTALEHAIQVLRAGTSLLQQGSRAYTAILAVAETLPSAAQLKQEQVALLTELSSGSQGSKYAPQSMSVQGILIDMYQQFAASLESAMRQEATKNRNFELFVAEKMEQLAAKKAEKETKEKEKADTETKLADYTQQYDDTKAQKGADIEFFDTTKEACESKHEEWVKRTTLRTEELEGITKAIEILDNDEARKLFASTIKPGKETGANQTIETDGVAFVQLHNAGTAAAPIAHAFAALKKSASRAHSLRLAALAVQVHEAKAGHFDEVIKAIDAMIVTLQEEGKEDTEKRDQCKSEYQKIASKVANVDWLIAKNDAAIDKLQSLIEELTEAKTKTIEEIAEVQDQMKAMTKERKAENADFKNGKTDDQRAIELLTKAKNYLVSYFEKNSFELGPIQGGRQAGVEMLQRGPEFDISEDQAPEAEFSEGDKRKQETKGVISILTMIIEDLGDEIRNAMEAEFAAQKEYEKQMGSAEKLETELTEKKVNIEDMIAKRTEEMDAEETAKKSNQEDMASENKYKADIAPDCDWVINAFDERASKREAEMNGLKTAKEFLSGFKSNKQALLEQKHSTSFDDSVFPGLRFLGVRE